MKVNDMIPLPVTIMAEQETCAYIAASKLVPKDWSWFWNAFTADNPPFSWGDNNRTLVTLVRFTDYVQSVIDIASIPKKYAAQYARWMRELQAMCTTEICMFYVDLES